LPSQWPARSNPLELSDPTGVPLTPNRNTRDREVGNSREKRGKGGGEENRGGRVEAVLPCQQSRLSRPALRKSNTFRGFPAAKWGIRSSRDNRTTHARADRPGIASACGPESIARCPGSEPPATCSTQSTRAPTRCAAARESQETRCRHWQHPATGRQRRR